MGATYVPSAPVLSWLEHEVLPRYGSTMELARALATRSAIQEKSWQRNLLRLRSYTRIDFFTLDRLCSLLDEHVSRFCDLHQFEQEEVAP